MEEIGIDWEVEIRSTRKSADQAARNAGRCIEALAEHIQRQKRLQDDMKEVKTTQADLSKRIGDLKIFAETIKLTSEPKETKRLAAKSQLMFLLGILASLAISGATGYL